MPDDPNATSETPTSTAGIVADLTANEPTINETTVEGVTNDGASANGATVPATEPGTNAATGNTTPNVPEAFDPAIHERDDTGNPRLTKDGRFRRKRGGGAAKARANPPSGVGAVAGATTVTPTDPRGTAVFFTSTGFAFATKTFGPHWKPDDSERDNINNAATRFVAANGIPDLPPGIALLLAVGTYAFPRAMQHEAVRNVFTGIGVRLGLLRATQSPPQPARPTANPNQDLPRSPAEMNMDQSFPPDPETAALMATRAVTEIKEEEAAPGNQFSSMQPSSVVPPATTVPSRRKQRN